MGQENNNYDKGRNGEKEIAGKIKELGYPVVLLYE